MAAYLDIAVCADRPAFRCGFVVGAAFCGCCRRTFGFIERILFQDWSHRSPVETSFQELSIGIPVRRRLNFPATPTAAMEKPFRTDLFVGNTGIGVFKLGAAARTDIVIFRRIWHLPITTYRTKVHHLPPLIPGTSPSVIFQVCWKAMHVCSAKKPSPVVWGWFEIRTYKSIIPQDAELFCVRIVPHDVAPGSDVLMYWSRLRLGQEIPGQAFAGSCIGDAKLESMVLEMGLSTVVGSESRHTTRDCKLRAVEESVS